LCAREDVQDLFVKRVEEEAKVFLGIFLEATLNEHQLAPHPDLKGPTLIESNLLFSFIASYTFSGTNASRRASRLLASVLGVEVPEGGACPGVDANSRRKMILAWSQRFSSSEASTTHIASRSGVFLARSAFNRFPSSSNSSVKGVQ
jgi:hypothetical protein